MNYLLSFHNMYLNFIHVFAWLIVHSFLLLNSISLSVCISSFTYLHMERHFGCLSFPLIINKPATSIYGRFLYRHKFSHFSRYIIALIRFPKWQMKFDIFSILICHVYIFFDGCLFRSFLFLIGLIVLLLLLEYFVYFTYNSFITYMSYKYFPNLWLAFSFSWMSFSKQFLF